MCWQRVNVFGNLELADKFHEMMQKYGLHKGNVELVTNLIPFYYFS